MSSLLRVSREGPFARVSLDRPDVRKARAAYESEKQQQKAAKAALSKVVHFDLASAVVEKPAACGWPPPLNSRAMRDTSTEPSVRAASPG